MKKQLMIVGIIVIFLTVGLSGCNEEKDTSSNPNTTEENRFLGTWYNNSWTITFFSDGTYTESFQADPWEIKDGKLLLYSDSSKVSFGLFDYDFSDNETKLTLTQVSNGKITIFTKK